MKKFSLKKHGIIILFLLIVVVGATNPEILKSFTGAISGVASKDVVCSEWYSIGCGVAKTENLTAYLSTSRLQTDSVFVCNYDKGCEITHVNSSDFSGCSELYLRKNGFTFFNGGFAPWNLKLTDVVASLNGFFLAGGDSLTLTCVPSFIFDGSSNLSVSFTAKRLRLAYCSSGSTVVGCNGGTDGTAIATDGCAFNATQIGLSNDSLIINPSSTSILARGSYVVKEGENVWIPNPNRTYVCGKSGDTCTVDSDCWNHPFSYGGYIGNADVVGTQLVLYGCAATGSATGECDKWSGIVAGQGTCSIWRQSKQCGIVRNNVLTVECTPNTSTCGPNAVCDPVTFKCKATGTVACSSNATCGTAVHCDVVSKTLKELYCKNAGTINSVCDIRVLQSIECCYTPDCGAGYFCNSSHACQKQEQQCQACPWPCCEGLCTTTGYFPNVPIGKHCCPDHTNTYTTTTAECNPFRCTSDSDCLKNERCNKDTGKCESNVVCEEQKGDGILILGYSTLTAQSPIYAIPFPWGGGLFEIGKTTTVSCNPVYNIYLIAGIIVATILGIAFMFSRKGKRKRRKK